MNLNIKEEYYGELLPFIKDEKITDITWNGRALWLDHLEKGRYEVEGFVLTNEFIDRFSTRLANLVNRNFNESQPKLEAETEDLRISVIEPSVTNTGPSIAIRKTPAIRRLNETKMMKDGYANILMLLLLQSLVKGHCSFIVTGDVGSGKTELIKYLTKFIPNHERTISIEDNYELRLAAINPKLDCVEQKVEPWYTYQDAIKVALRQLCKWLLMSEARSKEVTQLLEAASTGCGIMTTIHSDDVRKLPDRVVNMIGGEAGKEKMNDVYNFFDVGVKVSVSKTEGKIKRWISQIGIFDRENDVNKTIMIYDEGRFTGENLPPNIEKKLKEANVENPLNLPKEKRDELFQRYNPGEASPNFTSPKGFENNAERA